MLSKYFYILKRTCRDETYSPPVLLLLYALATKLRVTKDTFSLWPTCSEICPFSHLHCTAPVALSFQCILKMNRHVNTIWIVQFLSPAPIQTSPRKTRLWGSYGQFQALRHGMAISWLLMNLVIQNLYQQWCT